MKHLYSMTDRIGSRATLGLIVLQSDETLEQEFRQVFTAKDVAIYTSRVPNAATVTTDTLGAMADEIPAATRLLPPSLDYSAIAYCCTSGATVIGPARVADLVSEAAKTQNVTNPISAVMAGLNAVGARRVGMLTPYIASVTGPMRDLLVAHGFQIPTCVSFEEDQDPKVARIDGKSIIDAAVAAGSGDVDAVFLSCTNLRTFDVIEEIEARLDKPVISSNQALAWHMARLAGTTPDVSIGRLMAG